MYAVSRFPNESRDQNDKSLCSGRSPTGKLLTPPQPAFFFDSHGYVSRKMADPQPETMVCFFLELILCHIGHTISYYIFHNIS